MSETREAFHTRRQGRFYSTDVSRALGISPFGGGYEVQLEKLGKLEPDDRRSDDAIDHGIIYEQAVLDYAERDLKKLDYQKLDRNVVVQDSKSILAATLDARVANSGPPVEAKTTGLVGPIYGDWGDPDSDRIPEVYLVQAHVQITCSDADRGFVYALIGGRGTIRYIVERNETMCTFLREFADQWWDRHIVQGIPVESETPPNLEVLKRIRRQPESVTELDDEARQLADHWEALCTAYIAAKKLKERAASELILRLADAEAGSLPDGRVVEYCKVHRRGYVVEPCNFRQLKIRVPKY